MGALTLQPLEISDFSGGLTDNFLKGGVNRYTAADNFLLTVDHKLKQRNGSIIFDSTYYRVPSKSRVAGLFLGINDSILLAQNSRSIYDTATFSEILGPSSNPALGEGDIYLNPSFSEWQRQVFVTSDQSVSTFPSILFRDTSNAWKAVTAGLPRAYGPPTYTNSSLLNACITLANAIRTSMISHFGDYDPAGAHPTFYLHTALDKYSLSYLATQSWASTDNQFPGPGATAAPAATDQASLFTLVGALVLAFKNHVPDDFPSNTTPSSPHALTLYHYNNFALLPSQQGPHASLSNYTVPSDLTTAATQLDDLYTKWKWHQLSVNTHSFTNDFTQINKYLVTAPKIGRVALANTYPAISPQYTDLYNYANILAKMYNAHVQSGGGLQAYDPVNFTSISSSHAEPDTTSSTAATTYVNSLPVNFATDYETYALSIYWTRALYYFHQADSALLANNQVLTFNSTVGSADLANVSVAIFAGEWVYAAGCFNASPGNGGIAKVLVGAAAAGTATVDRTANNTTVAFPGQRSPSTPFHMAQVPGTTYQPAAGETLTLGADSIGSTYQDWLTLGTELFNSLNAHKDNAKTHPSVYTAAFWASKLQNLGFFIPTVETHSYAFVYSYTYTVEPNGVEYEIFGNPVFSDSISAPPVYPPNYTISSVTPAEYNSLTVTGAQFALEGATLTLPKIVNDHSTNYDTGSIRLNIYKTLNGGQVWRKVTDVANGVTSYFEQSSDTLSNAGGLSSLVTQETLYTTNGTVAYDQAPISRCLHILNGVALYGYITDTGQVFPNRIRQASPGTPYSSPATFTDDLEDEVVSISSTRDKFIVLCKSSLYRITGLFTATGQGNLTHERFSNTMGCISPRSVVRTELGVFFAGTDGFYYTDGFQLIKISLELNQTYQKIIQSETQRKRINGCYDKSNRTIYWNVQEAPSDTDCNKTFVFYLDYGIKPSGVFTSCSSTTNWRPSSMVFKDGVMIRGDERGYLFKEDENSKTDPEVVTANPITAWQKAYMPFDYTSCALDFGTERFRKWVPKVHFVGENIGNQSIQINSINDNEQRVPQSNTGSIKGIFSCSPINYTANPTWGQPNPIWGTSSYLWKYDGKNDVMRRIPAGGMRSGYRQFQLTNLRGAVYRYDDFPAFSFASVNAIAKGATLTPVIGFSSSKWPLDVVGMYISFDNDNYTNEFLITAVSGNVLDYSDGTDLSVTNTQAKWVIRGYKKESRISITSLTPWFAILGDEFDPYQKSDGGENQ